MRADQRIDVAVVGGGIIGLSIAWQARRRLGLEVAVLERGELGHGASHVAAGMLAPATEAEFGQAGRRLLELGLASAERWPRFAAELSDRAGVPVELARPGMLLLAGDDDEARELERQVEFRRGLGLEVTRLRPSAARELEPALAPTLRLAAEVPGDAAVDPRIVLDALRRACERDGVELREHCGELAVQAGGDGDHVEGVVLAGGERVACDTVVVAAGAASGALGGVTEDERPPVRPVKGQILRLRDPAGPGLVRRVLRYEGGYVVPRGDGRYVLGATMEERGEDLAATVGAVHELVREARRVLPGIVELELEEVSVGLRPGTPDNVPVIGAAREGGIVWACGHHRNGILLAPLTAELVTALLEGAVSEPQQRLLGACSPLRFAAPLEPPLGAGTAGPVGAAR
jgi:glycine oxidase